METALSPPIPTLSQVQAERARRRLSKFVRHAWEVLNPGRTLDWSWYLDAICLHLEAVSRAFRGETVAAIRRLLINQPPNTLKSTVISVCWPAWTWIEYPQIRFLFAANDGPLATRDAVAMRDLVESQWYRRSFHPQWELRPDQDQKTWFTNTAGGHRISYSANAKVTGKKGDILVVDDANDAKKVNSDVDRQAVVDWHDQAFSGRMADEIKSPEVVIGQRVHKGDLIGHLKSKGGWTELRLAEEFNPATRCVTLDDAGAELWRDPRTSPGEWLRPTRFAATQRDEAIGRLGSAGFSTQHNQDPKDRAGAMFQRHWFKLKQSAPRAMARVRYWDTASTEDGAYTVGVLIAKDTTGIYWIEDVVRARLTALGRDQLMLQTCGLDRSRYGRVVQVIERQGGGSGKDVAEATVRMLAGFEVKIDTVSEPKPFRAGPLASQAEAGNVCVLDRPWTAAFLDEIAEFPGGRYLDQGDAAGGGFSHVSQMSVGGPTIGIPSREQQTLTGGLPDGVFK